MKHFSNALRRDEAVDGANALTKAMKQFSNKDVIVEVINQIEEINTQLADANSKVFFDHQVNERNKVVNACFLVIRGLAEAYMKSSDSTLKEAATKIMAVLVNHKTLTHLNVAEKSGKLDALMLDFAADDVKTAAAAIPGLNDCIARLKTAGDDLAEHRYMAQKERSDANATKTSDLKKQLYHLINNKLIVMLTNAAITEPELYQPELKMVEDIIDEYNNLAKSHRNNTKK